MAVKTREVMRRKKSMRMKMEMKMRWRTSSLMCPAAMKLRRTSPISVSANSPRSV